MRVTGKTLSKSETTVELDLFEGRKLTKAVKRRIQDDVGNYLVEQTLIAMNEKKSPVQGEGSFKALSPLYKKKKLSEVGSGEANLEFDGVLKDELDFKTTDKGISIGVFGERAPAADGHCNLSGDSRIPKRRFLPDEGQNYKSPIRQEVERIVADAIAEETTIKESLFRYVETKSELYSVLGELFGPMTRKELELIVYRNTDLYDTLNNLDLLRLL